MARSLPPDRAQNAHNNFQDPSPLSNRAVSKASSSVRCRRENGDPSVLFRVSIAQTTVVPPGKVGIITAADGSPLDQGRLHGKAIEDHKNFQDAEAFIYNGGQKGPQVEILTPGTYRIHALSTSSEDSSTQAGLFDVRFFDADRCVGKSDRPRRGSRRCAARS